MLNVSNAEAVTLKEATATIFRQKSIIASTSSSGVTDTTEKGFRCI
jgi:hypothetical protein